MQTKTATQNTDANARRATSKAANRDGSEFHRLLEALPAGAYTCDADGLITYFNQHAVALWGRTPALNDSSVRFCGSFKLFAKDGTSNRPSHRRRWERYCAGTAATSFLAWHSGHARTAAAIRRPAFG